MATNRCIMILVLIAMAAMLPKSNCRGVPRHGRVLAFCDNIVLSQLFEFCKGSGPQGIPKRPGVHPFDMFPRNEKGRDYDTLIYEYICTVDPAIPVPDDEISLNCNLTRFNEDGSIRFERMAVTYDIPSPDMVRSRRIHSQWGPLSEIEPLNEIDSRAIEMEIKGIERLRRALNGESVSNEDEPVRVEVLERAANGKVKTIKFTEEEHI